MDNNEGQSILQLINKKQFLLEPQHDVILDILSREEHQRIVNNVGEFRARTYTPLKTLHMNIQQVLSSDKSCNNAIAGVNAGRLMSGKTPVCPNSGSYTKAKKRLSEDLIHELVKSVGHSSLKKIPLGWNVYGRDVKLFDGTTLTLQDTKANNKQYPKHSNKNLEVGYPQVRLLAVFSLITGSVVDYALDATKGKGTGEITLLRSILDCINEGDIAIGDALFCNFFLMHDLLKKKVDVIVPGHIQRHYDFNEGTILGEKDHITQWKKPRKPTWMSKEAYKKYPKEIQIREFEVNGSVYMTTFMDASLYSKKELHKLYKRRWDVELHLRSIKTHMGMDMLSGATPSMIRKEIGVHLLAYNIIRELMVDGGIKGNTLPTQISFKGTLQLLNQFTPYFISNKKDKKAALYCQMLMLIVKNKIGKRPGRVEPRAIRKRSPSFPTLKADRKAEKEKILLQRKKWMDENKAA
jgi:IS4 transposase